MISTYAWVSGGELPSQRLRSYTFGLAAAVGFLGAVSISNALPYGFNLLIISCLVANNLHCTLLHQPGFVELGVSATSAALLKDVWLMMRLGQNTATSGSHPVS
jgi:hypothetical protein